MENEKRVEVENEVYEIVDETRGIVNKNGVGLDQEMLSIRKELNGILQNKLNVNDARTEQMVEDTVFELTTNLQRNVVNKRLDAYGEIHKEIRAALEYGIDNNFEGTMNKIQSFMDNILIENNRLTNDAISRAVDDAKQQFFSQGRSEEDKSNFSNVLRTKVEEELAKTFGEQNESLRNEILTMVDARIKSMSEKINEKSEQEKDIEEKDTKEEKFLNDLKSSTYSEQEVTKNQESRESKDEIKGLDSLEDMFR